MKVLHHNENNNNARCYILKTCMRWIIKSIRLNNNLDEGMVSALILYKKIRKSLCLTHYFSRKEIFYTDIDYNGSKILIYSHACRFLS